MYVFNLSYSGFNVNKTLLILYIVDMREAWIIK